MSASESREQLAAIQRRGVAVAPLVGCLFEREHVDPHGLAIDTNVIIPSRHDRLLPQLLPQHVSAVNPRRRVE